MKTVALAVILIALLGGCTTLETSKSDTNVSSITHTVFFKLKHPEGSNEEAYFLSRAQALSDISTVQDFAIVKETSPKNNFDYGLFMVFDNQADYTFYNDHPDHVDFVKNIWIPNVVGFEEIDYIEYTP
ncbi:Dabb family protein [Rubellicoccus peritrichatus]|uniref:Dabb family protein n=1 Tax=Rubellicoccus peritrichatus TaxID=3080537 RepID=A0AAQ3LEM9_9BACT|nr:Dabb family protein [Puniceicoccus sp. CR14]WOO43312.1 Dabb family protein [Puniceicoccus sp. CR14]